MRILFAYADVAEGLNATAWRILIPGEALRRAGHRVEVITIHDLVRRTHHFTPRDFDIVVAERELFHQDTQILTWQHDVPILATFDDAYHLIPASVSTSRVWKKAKIQKEGENRPVMQEFKKLLRKLDGYITPSELLTSDFASINAHSYTIPNYADLSSDAWKIPRVPHDGPIRLVWGGSSSHYDSWRDSGIVPALTNLLQDRDDINLTLIGGDLRIPAFFAGLSPDKVRYHPGTSFAEWPKLLAHFDIGLAPLAGEYDRRRSWIKVLEYALIGLPSVASNLEPYFDTPTWLVPKNRPDKWLARICTAIAEHKQLGDEATEEAKEWAWQQGIDDHVGEYVTAFEDAISRREQ